MKIRPDEAMIVNGRLKQIGASFFDFALSRVAVFECLCGRKKVIRYQSVKSAKTNSCGCIASEITVARSTGKEYSKTHGMIKSREYRSWSGMKGRCTNPKNQKWYAYGERGITVCDRWFSSFENFFSDMGVCPSGMTLDRENTNGNYEPDNCRWATPLQQANNTRTNIIVEIDGVSRTVAEWSRISGVDRGIIYRRLGLPEKWSVRNAVFDPPEKCQQRKRKK